MISVYSDSVDADCADNTDLFQVDELTRDELTRNGILILDKSLHSQLKYNSQFSPLNSENSPLSILNSGNSQFSPLNYYYMLHWYALRVTYSRELALKEYLDTQHIESFIPMHYEYMEKDGRRLRKLVPAVHNLVFVHSTRARIDALKDEAGMRIPIRYIMDRANHAPIIIPDAQMRSFILVAGSYEEAILYVEPAELQLVKGQRVRITGGIFEGVVGEFVRIRRDRRVVVNIEGVMAVATTFIHSSLVQPIEEENNSNGK